MKNSFHKTSPYLIMSGFLLYWLIVLVLSLPSNRFKQLLESRAPRFKDMFSSSWKLFTPPYTYNNRLYFIASNVNGQGKADTIEVLSDLSRQKQKKAPFNQQENIIDHLIEDDVMRLITTIWGNNESKPPVITDSGARTYVARMMANAQYKKNYSRRLLTLNNYCRLVLTERKIDTACRNIKIVITKKMMRPFQEMGNPGFLQPEMLAFEAPYQPLHP